MNILNKKRTLGIGASRPEQFEFPQGAKERATGVYFSVNEDGERRRQHSRNSNCDGYTKKILIVAPAWIGDLIMAQALFKLLKKKLPQVTIDVLAHPNWHPLLQNMSEVNRVLAYPFAHGKLHFKQRYQLGKSLRSKKYQQAIILPNSWKSALLPFWARIPERTGWRGEMRYGLINDLRLLNKNKLPLHVERFLTLGLAKQEKLPQKLPLPALRPKKSSLHKTLAKLKIDVSQVKTKPILVFCPGAAYGAAKCWPAEYFAKVAKVKDKEGWQIWILGSAKDQAIGAAIQKAADNICLDFTGKTDVGMAMDLLSLANMVIANDTGLMHLTAALNRPLIAIYGSSSPAFTPPLSKQAKIASLNLPCSPCLKRTCPFNDARCLYNLKPRQVLRLFP